MITTDDIVQESLTLRGWGWSVFPLKNKVPAVRWKIYQRRRPSEPELERMFRIPGVDGIGAVTGPISGNLFSRDFATRPRTTGGRTGTAISRAGRRP